MHPDMAVLRGLFGEVFRRHTPGAAEVQLGIGRRTGATPRPWVFMRILLLVGASYLVLFALAERSQNPNLLPAVIVLGALAVPLATAVFFFECNIPRNLSLYVFVKCLAAGSVISIVFASILYMSGNTLVREFGPSAAAFIEEPAKLAAVLLLARRLGAKWILNGLVLGSAVGAGFAVIESAGYGFVALSESGLQGLSSVTELRGVTAVGAHVTWTAVVAGAYWVVAHGDVSRTGAAFTDYRFLVPAGMVVAIHYAWNSPLTERGGWFWILLLTTLSLYLAMSYLTLGLRQYRQAL